jgi:hypothetical protein
MNRKERRAASKRLGILQFQNKLPRNKKFDLIRENIITGNQQQKELKEELKRHNTKQEEEVESKVVYNIAENIIKGEKIPFGEAIKKATETYDKDKE